MQKKGIYADGILDEEFEWIFLIGNWKGFAVSVCVLVVMWWNVNACLLEGVCACCCRSWRRKPVICDYHHAISLFVSSSLWRRLTIARQQLYMYSQYIVYSDPSFNCRKFALSMAAKEHNIRHQPKHIPFRHHTISVD